MGPMLSPSRSLLLAGSLLVVLVPACSSGGSGSGGETCPAGFDGGQFISGPESVAESGRCGNLLNGTKQDGDACQADAECAPTCCACPNGGGKSAQVAWCSMGKCVVGATSCCAFVYAGAQEMDGGAPFVCQN
jgi:hypothetical protein